MEQSTINQRIKFLIETLGLSARAFSEVIGESPTNVHNYTGKRNSMPGADFLEKVLLHFENVNPMWLITGQGKPLTGESSAPIINLHPEKSSGSFIGVNTGTAIGTIGSLTLDDCKQALQLSQQQVEHLQAQLKMQETVIAAKEETITLLRASFNRPN